MSSSELILNPDGSVYHLHVKKENLSPVIFLVGDPDRVLKVARKLDSIEFETRKREFVSVTGYYQNQLISVVSSGIGTDNIDIVINEIDAAFNVDPQTGLPVENPTQLTFIRLGTCGCVQPEIPVHSMIFSEFAIALEGLPFFYKDSVKLNQDSLQIAFADFLLQHYDAVPVVPMAFQANAPATSPNWESKFQVFRGITATACGFYAPQGRSLGRTPLQFPGLQDKLSAFLWENHKVLNFEMETSAIFMLGNLLGHKTASLSVVLANRARNEFSEKPEQAIERLIEAGLEWISR